MSARSVREYLEEIDAVHQEVREALGDLDRSELRYATDNPRSSTLRHVLLRLGDHLREHTTQLIAAREDVGAKQGMPQRILARAEEAYGGLLGAMVGLRDEDLDSIPEPGEWSPRQVLEHLIAVQRQYLDTARRARRSAVPAERA